ncbi:MAG TPA: hypothetical protein VIQ24_06125, partial [Pyrinomonadaceae bacterium]
MTMTKRHLKLLTLLLALSLNAPAQEGQRSAPRPPATRGANAQAATREQRIAQAAEAMRAQLVAQRRDFHMHPELSNREERTSRIVAERLKSLGFDEVRTGVARHGVVAVLKGGRPGGVVAVRADMDALPIQETNDLPYKSRTP